MNACRFVMLENWSGWECEVCHRRIASMTVRNDLNGSLFVAACGVQSEYDEPRQQVNQEPQRYHHELVRRENELIGQEGGRWDKFYKENA